VIDPFATLGLERSYRQDLRAVEKVHRDLSRALHPDRHARGGASERRQALEHAVLVNEAWRIVRDPIRRAEAIFSLAGVSVGEVAEPQPSPELLMEMMEQREALADARAEKDLARVQALARDMGRRDEAVQDALATGFEAAGGKAEALTPLVARLGELRYVRRFLDEASAMRNDLEATP
jgi:molecular chaperone HscB